MISLAFDFFQKSKIFLALKVQSKLFFYTYLLIGKFGKKPKDKLVLITGASATHQASLIQLIESTKNVETNSTIYIFDLGLDAKYRAKLNTYKKYLDLVVIDYNFKEKPSWMNIANSNKGEWAWKPDCIKTVITLRNREETADTNCYLWLDAGAKVVGSLNLIHRHLHRAGFYSPASSGFVEEWTHPEQIRIVCGHQRFSRNLNLDGSIIGFCSESQKSVSLLNEWFELSRVQSIIAPAGSNRLNHRQDQSLLTLLAYKNRISPKKWELGLHNGAILRHQDID